VREILVSAAQQAATAIGVLSSVPLRVRRVFLTAASGILIKAGEMLGAWRFSVPIRRQTGNYVFGRKITSR
jgi:hypothetical protein